MPHKVWAVGEEVLAADFNNYVQNQTVPRFTNATQRSSQLTAPVLNQLSILDTRPGVIQYWNGTAWSDQQALTFGGLNPYTTDANGIATIVYGFTFASSPPPKVVANPQGNGLPGAVFCVIADITTTQVKVRVFNAGGTPYASQAVSISWLVTGVVP